MKYIEKIVSAEEAAEILCVDVDALTEATEKVNATSDDYIELGNKYPLEMAVKEFCKFINQDVKATPVVVDEVMSFCDSVYFDRCEGKYDLGFLMVAFNKEF